MSLFNMPVELTVELNLERRKAYVVAIFAGTTADSIRVIATRYGHDSTPDSTILHDITRPPGAHHVLFELPDDWYGRRITVIQDSAASRANLWPHSVPPRYTYTPSPGSPKVPTFEEVFGQQASEFTRPPRLYTEAELLKEDVYTIRETAAHWKVPGVTLQMSKREIIYLMMKHQWQVHKPMLDQEFKKNRWQKISAAIRKRKG